MSSRYGLDPFGRGDLGCIRKAHPRRYGIADHMGVTLVLPSVGAGKSRRVGRHREVGSGVGDREPLRDKDEILGMVLRTKPRVKSVYLRSGWDNQTAWA